MGSTSSSFCLCNAGYSGADGAPCSACASGTYKAGVSSAACTSCPLNSMSANAIAFFTSCVCATSCTQLIATEPTPNATRDEPRANWCQSTGGAPVLQILTLTPYAPNSLWVDACIPSQAKDKNATCVMIIISRSSAPPGACVWGQLCMYADKCIYVCTGIANSPCSWCAGNMSPPRLPQVDRRHLLPGHLLHGCTIAGAGVPRCERTGTGGRCGRAVLCAHGRAMPVTRLRARRLNRADAQSSGEGAARPPLCVDEAGESWSGRGHRGCMRRCLRAGVCTSVLGSLTRPAAGAQATCPPLAGAGGPSSPAPGPSTPRLYRCRCWRATL